MCLRNATVILAPSHKGKNELPMGAKDQLKALIARCAGIHLEPWHLGGRGRRIPRFKGPVRLDSKNPISEGKRKEEGKRKM